MSALTLVQWREPLWLWLALYPLLMLLLATVRRYWQRDPYAEASLLPWVLAGSRQKQQQRLRHLSFILAWLCFAIAIAGPRLAEKIYHSAQDQYSELMIVLDLSQSMAAKDILPSRLQRARLELLDFLQGADQLRVGLTVFAARPHLLSPMTYDKAVIRHYLAALKPSLLPTAGSDIKAALLFASQQFHKSLASPRAILLLSDGNSAVPADLQALQSTAQQLKQQRIQVYSLGLGTPAGQAVIATLDPRFGQMQTAITSLQRDSLQSISRLTNGLYTDVSDTDSDWQQLYDQGIGKLASSVATQKTSTDKILWHELYHWPLLCALGFFMLALFTSNKQTMVRYSPLLLLIYLAVFFSAGTPPPLQAAELTYAQAYKTYQQGDYQQAREQFARLPGYAARLGEANALYQLHDYIAARDLYIQAVLNADSDQQRATALFNLGNSFYQLKEYILAGQMYRDVLRYQATHPAAQTNLLHAEREQRLKAEKEALTYRPGSGPRTAQAAKDLDLSNTQVSLGESTSTPELALPDVASQTTTAATIFAETELANQNIETDRQDNWTYKIHDVTELYTAQQNLNTDNTYVWQRLFEQEEGFPAPLARPYPITGVAPW